MLQKKYPSPVHSREAESDGEKTALYTGKTNTVTMRRGKNRLQLALKSAENSDTDTAETEHVAPVQVETTYTVYIWKEVVTGGAYERDEGVPREGLSGEKTAVEAEEITGFTAQEIAQQTIAEDGSTVVHVYYDRILYTVTYVQDEEIHSTAIPESNTFRYGATVETAFDTSDVTGYVLSWYTDEDLTTRFDPTEPLTSDLTLYAKWTEAAVHGISVSITPSDTTDITLTKTETTEADGSITAIKFTVTSVPAIAGASYAYAWTCEGNVLDITDVSATIDTTALTEGSYDVTVRVTVCDSDGNELERSPYTAYAQIVVR
ncbi:MAG: InlB B-repeat-containing protein [Treponema sp.]|nr:InlB B-repeat-containing protein [Treponema sp.]